MRTFIRFKHYDITKLTDMLFQDLSREAYAVGIGAVHKVGCVENIVIYQLIYPREQDYISRGYTHIKLSKEFFHNLIKQIVDRFDVNLICEIHSHPFSEASVNFSGIDDRDEETVAMFLSEKFDLGYASIVMGKKSVRGRVWRQSSSGPYHEPAIVKSQTAMELEGFRDMEAEQDAPDLAEMRDGEAQFNRGVLALGLDAMRRITSSSLVTIAGVGGLGSVMAEHLIHMGFPKIGLIDHDRLEISNMNRLVGAKFVQAKRNCKKVNVLARHLRSINPRADVQVVDGRVEEEKAVELMAASDWILLGTDNHTSRFFVQKTALEHFVPMLSVGVNITVEDGRVTDTSGEVITVRAGDCHCLNCLGRINPTYMAFESHPDSDVRSSLVQRGYVQGADVKEPAVKTLNTMLATMAVDRLVDQYLPERPDPAIMIYENNSSGPCIYPEEKGINLGCTFCDL